METTSPQPGKHAKPRKPGGRLTYKIVEEALRGSAGIQSVAAEKLGVHRSTICLFVRKNPKLSLVIDEIVESALDLAESKLLVAIGKGDVRAITYYLENKGASRGYGIKKTAFTDLEGNQVIPATLTVPMRVLSAEDWQRETQIELAARAAALEAPTIDAQRSA